MALTPPDDAACWDGPWAPVDAASQMWLFAGLLRTVDALQRLHPLRLGDTKGSRRILLWSAARLDDDHPRPAFAVLTEQARDPGLAVGTKPDDLLIGGDFDALGALVGEAFGSALGLGGRLLDTSGDAPRWAGVVTRLPGAWLPPLAVLPRAGRDLVDPATAWTTESLDFNERLTVHAADHRVAADLLAPHVMAILMDRVPAGAAVTAVGDAVHVWWPHRPPLSGVSGLVSRMVDAARALAEAIPSFVLTNHPDRSDEVEAELGAKAEDAEAYRAQRRPGTSRDPVMQRIYDQARATYAAGGDVSSAG